MSKEYTAIADVIGNEVIFYFGDENGLTKCMVIDLSKKDIVRWQATNIKLAEAHKEGKNHE